ncbi:SDR family NAD(P)-dependent oxidoreductase, partial [Microbispora sitophila]|uniref:SDR family NAD(P)-dependent oxidoreductase n=1 Tax=Microbispora sitophila TaxID=2771537 RepID=UPI001D02FB3D
DRPEPHTAVTAAAHAHTHGTPVDWTTLHGQATTIDLPTYAFQRRRHWVSPPQSGQGGPYDDGKARFWDIVSRGDLDALVGTLGAEAERVRRSLGDALPVLASWHAARDARTTLDSWRYRVVWRPVEEPALRSGGRWLLVRTAWETAAAWAKALQHVLEERGAEVTEAVVGGKADRDSLVASLTSVRTGERFTGVVSLLGLDGTPYEGQDIALLQALDAAAIDGPLWLTTSGAVAAAPSDRVPNPAGGLAWGLSGVIAAERPERWAGIVDLPPLHEPLHGSLRGSPPDGRSVAYAVTALTGPHGESELAVRASGLLARRLVPAPSREATPAEWAPAGTVLITGGTGALGAHVARRLARRGVPHLLLVSRRGLDAPGAEDLHAELTRLGARVTVAACDVSDRDALAAVLAAVPPEHPLTAVVHTAAVLDDGLLGSLTPERLAAVNRVKVGGALALHELTRELPLTAFVLFSSVTGLIGNPGQGNYAPGNAFLDALAEHRRSLGLPATSVAWGHWDGEGIAGEEAREGLRRSGFPPMAPDLAVSALEEAVAAGETRLVVARADWATVHAVRPHPLLAELPEARAAAPSAAETSGGEPDLPARLAGLPEPERRPTLRALVRAEIADVLGYGSAAEVDDDRGFRDQGFTSLSAVELRNRLTRLTGTPLSSTLVFDYPTPAGLVDHLLNVLLPDPEPPVAAVLAKLGELETLLGETVSPSDREAAADRLRRLAELLGETQPDERPAATADLSSASDDELIDFISNELGIS